MAKRKKYMITYPRDFANEVSIRIAEEGERYWSTKQEAREAIRTAYAAAGYSRGFGGYCSQNSGDCVSIYIDLPYYDPYLTPFQALDEL